MGKKLTQKDFIERCKNKHGNKYDYSKVIYKGIDIKVCIICPEHGEFWLSPYCFLKSEYGCPECGKINALVHKKRLTTEEFIEKAQKVHENKYDYSKVEYINNSTKVCIICPEHGEFWQLPFDHLRSRGCPECAKINIGNKKRSDFNVLIKKLADKHNNYYVYDTIKLKQFWKNVDTKIPIICPEHGEFWQTPKKHLQGQGCPKCKYSKISVKRRLTTKEFIEKAKQIHDDKYDYSKVDYINSSKSVCIICPKHGDFIQRPDKHLQGHGCQKCGTFISVVEEEFYSYIKNNFNMINILKHDRNILNGKELDIYIPSKNIAIEYNGILWHSEKYGKDCNYHLNKLNMCNEKGIKLIQIFEDEYLEHKEIVLSKIKHLLKKDDDLPKIFARKCNIKEINKDEAKSFFEFNHIQGFVPSTVYLGCYCEDTIVGVMTFKEEKKGSNRWELNRFATDINKHCVGVGGKLFKYFIKNYNPEYIKSFADRRWTLDKDDNLYTNLGFKLTEILKPDYRYFFQNGYGVKRVHKFNFRKQVLMKKYSDAGLTMEMTEKEICDKIGAYRIWDCGLFKYEWENT